MGGGQVRMFPLGNILGGLFGDGDASDKQQGSNDWRYDTDFHHAKIIGAVFTNHNY